MRKMKDEGKMEDKNRLMSLDALRGAADGGRLLLDLDDMSVGSGPVRGLRLMSYNVHHCAGADKNLDFDGWRTRLCARGRILSALTRWIAARSVRGIGFLSKSKIKRSKKWVLS